MPSYFMLNDKVVKVLQFIPRVTEDNTTFHAIFVLYSGNVCSCRMPDLGKEVSKSDWDYQQYKKWKKEQQDVRN
jgi:hypothetical protein